MEKQRSVVIIGGGPSGLTAAIYTARAQMKPLMIEGFQPGGQLTTTTEVENYPGFASGVDGNELMQSMREQAERFGTEFLSESVISVDFSSRPFKIKTDSQEIEALSVIISTGAQPRMLGLDSEKALTGRGVSVCATCDGFFYRGKEVIVVGGGDAAMEEAIFLTRFASSVKIVHRRDQFRASPIMVQRARDNDKIEFLLNSTVDEIKANDEGLVDRVVLKNVEDGSSAEHAVDGVFISIGHKPVTGIFADALDLDEKGYILTTDTRTSVEGVFAAGDVQDSKYRQAVTAAGSGCQAALEAQWYIESLEAASPPVSNKKRIEKKKKKTKKTKKK